MIVWPHISVVWCRRYLAVVRVRRAFRRAPLWRRNREFRKYMRQGGTSSSDKRYQSTRPDLLSLWVGVTINVGTVDTLVVVLP